MLDRRGGAIVDLLAAVRRKERGPRGPIVARNAIEEHLGC